MRYKRKQCISTHLIGIDIVWTMIKNALFDTWEFQVAKPATRDKLKKYNTPPKEVSTQILQ